MSPRGARGDQYDAIMEGAVERVRPKIMTVPVAQHVMIDMLRYRAEEFLQFAPASRMEQSVCLSEEVRLSHFV